MQKDSKARNPKLSSPAEPGGSGWAGAHPPPGLARPRRSRARAQRVPQEDTALPGAAPGQLGLQPRRRWGWEGGEGTGHKAGTR